MNLKAYQHAYGGMAVCTPPRPRCLVHRWPPSNVTPKLRSALEMCLTNVRGEPRAVYQISEPAEPLNQMTDAITKQSNEPHNMSRY